MASVLTYPRDRYCRLHQTSGTAGRPLRWLDTPESWNWMLRCWETMFRIVGLRPADRLFFAFSFGPFLGFWTAFEAAEPAGLPVPARRRHEQRGPAAASCWTTRPPSCSARRPTPCTWPRWPGRRASTWPASPVRRRDRGRRAGRQHPGDRAPHRGGLGRSRLRPQRHDRGRARWRSNARRTPAVCTYWRPSTSPRSIDPASGAAGAAGTNSASWC